MEVVGGRVYFANMIMNSSGLIPGSLYKIGSIEMKSILTQVNAIYSPRGDIREGYKHIIIYPKDICLFVGLILKFFWIGRRFKNPVFIFSQWKDCLY
jgi:hypothetical protein